MGPVDFGVVNSAVDTVQPPLHKVTYIKLSDKDRYDIRKYASKHGPAAAVREFKRKFQNSMKVQHALSKRSMKKNLMEVKNLDYT